ncbi:MAG: hypothetical protein ACLF0P_02875 [Thermoanaerobaculia bacterium]
MTDRRDAERTAEVRLRGVLEPDEEALDRVVERALEGDGSGRRLWTGRAGSGPRRVLLPLGAGLLGTAAVVAVLFGPLSGPRPEPPELVTSGADPGPDPNSASLIHRDGVLIVRRLDGGTSLLDARGGRSAEPRGATIILTKGDGP